MSACEICSDPIQVSGLCHDCAAIEAIARPAATCEICSDLVETPGLCDDCAAIETTPEPIDIVDRITDLVDVAEAEVNLRPAKIDEAVNSATDEHPTIGLPAPVIEHLPRVAAPPRWAPCPCCGRSAPTGQLCGICSGMVTGVAMGYRRRADGGLDPIYTICKRCGKGAPYPTPLHKQGANA